MTTRSVFFWPPAMEICAIINWYQFTFGSLTGKNSGWGSPADLLPVCPRKLFSPQVSALLHQLLIAILLKRCSPAPRTHLFIEGIIVSSPGLNKKMKKRKMHRQTRRCPLETLFVCRRYGRGRHPHAPDIPQQRSAPAN